MTEQKTEISILTEAIKEAIYFLDAPEIPHNEVDMSMSIALKNALAEAEKAVSNFKPTWNLTQILIALEEAGFPHPSIYTTDVLSFNYGDAMQADWFYLRGIIHLDKPANWLDCNNSAFVALEDLSIEQAIEKLKQLLKDNT